MTIRTIEQVLLASAARTATPADIDVSFDGTQVTAPKNASLRNVRVIVDVSAIALTPSVTPSIVGVDPVSGNEYELLAGTAVTGTGTTYLEVGMDVETSAGVGQRAFLPASVRVKFTHADTDSITYSATIVAQFDMYQ